MQSVTENQEINKRLAAIQVALRNDMMMNQNDVEWIFKIIINNINGQVVTTNYLESEHPEWIGNTALHFAADERILEYFDVLLNNGADFTIKNSNNLTALHLIIERHITGMSKEYKLDNPFVNSVLSAHLKYSNFENPFNDYRLSHFHIACAANNVEAVKEFLQSGVFLDHAVKVDSPTFPGFTSLHFAAKYCALEVTELLLTLGANIHVKDAKGLTPVHVALGRKLKIISDIDSDKTLRDKNDKILQLLLNNKESNGDLVIIDDWGLSNFHVSCALKDSKVAERVLQKVVNINDTVNMKSSLWAGFTALHFAALCNVDVVKLLVKNGADINIKDAKGVTPFDLCIERYEIEDISNINSLDPVWSRLSDGETKLSDLVFAMRDSNQFHVFSKKLIKNISICRDSPLWSGCSPMHLAVMFAKTDVKTSEESKKMNLQVLAYLCKENPRMLHSQDVHGRTPLHLAYRLNKKPVIALMMEFLKGCSDLVDHVDEDSLSYVHIASAQYDIHILGRLLSVRTNVNIVYRGKSQFSPMVYSGSTPLHFAVTNGRKDAVNMLVRHGADVHAKDANDMTPIHLLLLSELASREMGDILLPLRNLRDSIVNGIGLSHLHVACWYRNEASLDIVKRLLDNGADINAKIICQQSINADSNILSLLQPYEGDSPLSIAYDEENYATLRLLLKRGADIFVEYTKGVTLLYHVFESDEYYGAAFMETVRISETLTARVIAETGMTSLHLACFDLNADLVEKSLGEGANVNAQIPSDSPILQGYTPMHILMHFSKLCRHEDVMEIIERLLKAGIDVTLQSAKLETAIHLAYKTFFDNQDKESYLRVNLLLEAQQDFSINPTSNEGISHFHIASYVCNAEIVEKFLNNVEIDINQWVDYFADETAGCSALQLAAGSSEGFCTVPRQLETMDLLLTRGADVQAEDCYGDTPLHYCTDYKNSIDLFERLASSGADVNARNITGDSPLYYYLKSKKASLEGIRALIRFGCRLNTYSAVTHEGYLGKILNVFPYPDVRILFSALAVNFKQEMQIDNLGRTVIHNIVSIKSPKISAKEYAELIEQLCRTGSDIDDQDNLGTTALHVAVKFYNFKAIAGLLLAGADINVADNNGKTALAADFDTCKQCEQKYRQDEKKCKHIETLQILATHVKKLKLLGLEVNKQNDDFTSIAFGKLQSETVLNNGLFKELEQVKSTKIESHPLTLYDFLSDYGVVVDYPRISEMKHNDVNKFFSRSRVQKVREQFPELAGILQLQYRKARVRSELVELAKNALIVLTGFHLPDICSEFILILLKNSELKNLIASISSTENAK